MQQAGTQPSSRAVAHWRARIAPGLSPVTSRTVRPNVPRLAQPVWKAMSVMDRSVSRSGAVARSIRRVSRYRCGGMPKACLNDRAKWACETPLTRASRRTGQASCELASIRSLARSSRRNSSGSWLAGSSRIAAFTSVPMTYCTNNEDSADYQQQQGCRVVNRPHRQAAGKDVAEEHHGSIGREHAAGRAGDDREQVRITGRQRQCCDLGLIADLGDEERDQRGEEGASLR